MTAHYFLFGDFRTFSQNKRGLYFSRENVPFENLSDLVRIYILIFDRRFIDNLYGHQRFAAAKTHTPGGGHNDIMEADMDTYFGAIVEFVERVLKDHVIGE